MDPFNDRLAASAELAGSWLCVGLDPDPARFPDGMEAEDVGEWCLGVLAATTEVACAVKPNAAFFEALGDVGEEALRQVIAATPPETPVILDGKRNDIGNTAGKYAEAAFDELGADAVTVNPYLGWDGVEPFAAYEDKGIFLLARTSNPSARDFQDLPTDAAGTPLWQAVATKAMREWQPDCGNLGLVAGATYPGELAQIRALCGDGVPLLIPGVGAQGADAAETLQNGGDTSGRFAVINVGRGLLYPKDADTHDGGWQGAVADAARGFAGQLMPRKLL
ncbi:MAG: orotidine-5'-phosphate decarboxylase [Thermoplasmatota archaeon]